MADAEEKPFPDVKEYVRNYTFDKEHEDTYKKLVKAYSVADRRKDNRLHQQGRKKVLNALEDMADDVNSVEHEDQLYKLLGKVLHKYDNAKVDIHNKTAEDDKKKSKIDFNDLSYKKRAQLLINSYIKNSQGKLDINSIINDIKEGNIEDVLDRLLLMEHNTYQRDMTVHKMEEVLPPNKDPNFYFKLANVWASKRQEDLTETDLRQRSVNRDTLLEYFLEDYNTAKENTLRKIKPDKKDGKVVSLSGGGVKMAA